MRELEKVRDNILQIFNSNAWIKFVHEGLIPAYTDKEKDMNVELAKLSNHCAICRNINACCFPKNNMPEYPLHPHCHCFLLDIPKPRITSECPKDKFERYIFSPKYEYKGKKKLFLEWGYDKINAEYLVQELTKQAKEKYASGDYTLGVLNEYGQRITIVVSLEHRLEKRIVRFKTGWMVYPDGNIKNTTPFSGVLECKNTITLKL